MLLEDLSMLFSLILFELLVDYVVAKDSKVCKFILACTVVSERFCVHVLFHYEWDEYMRCLFLFLQQVPKIYLTLDDLLATPEQGCQENDQKAKAVIYPMDIQHLMLYALQGTGSSYKPR